MIEYNCPKCGYELSQRPDMFNGDTEIFEIICDDCNHEFNVKVRCEVIYEHEVQNDADND